MGNSGSTKTLQHESPDKATSTTRAPAREWPHSLSIDRLRDDIDADLDDIRRRVKEDISSGARTGDVSKAAFTLEARISFTKSQQKKYKSELRQLLGKRDHATGEQVHLICP